MHISSPTSQPRFARATLSTLLALVAAAGLASAHDAGATNDHGDLSATPDPEACAVLFRATGVGAGGVFLEVHADAAEGSTLVTREFASGGPETPPQDPDRTFAFNESIGLTQDEALVANRIVMTFEEVTGEGERVRHSAEVLFTPFACAVDPDATAPPCPPDLRVAPMGTPEDPFNRLEWDEVPDADGYRVYRDGGAGFRLLLQQDAPFGTVFNDRGVEPGVTYRYMVTSFNDAGESEGCPVVEATAIPFFPAPLLGALALAGGLGAYGRLRRRAA